MVVVADLSFDLLPLRPLQQIIPFAYREPLLAVDHIFLLAHQYFLTCFHGLFLLGNFMLALILMRIFIDIRFLGHELWLDDFVDDVPKLQRPCRLSHILSRHLYLLALRC